MHPIHIFPLRKVYTTEYKVHVLKDQTANNGSFLIKMVQLPSQGIHSFTFYVLFKTIIKL